MQLEIEIDKTSIEAIKQMLRLKTNNGREKHKREIASALGVMSLFAGIVSKGGLMNEEELLEKYWKKINEFEPIEFRVFIGLLKIVSICKQEEKSKEFSLDFLNLVWDMYNDFGKERFNSILEVLLYKIEKNVPLSEVVAIRKEREEKYGDK